MKSLKYIAALVLVLIAGAAAHRMTRPAVIELTTAESADKAIKEAKGTVFLLARADDDLSKQTEAMFQKAAKDMRGQALFVEVNTTKVPELANMLTPVVYEINLKAGVMNPLYGNPGQQAIMEKAFGNFLEYVKQRTAPN